MAPVLVLIKESEVDQKMKLLTTFVAFLGAAVSSYAFVVPSTKNGGHSRRIVLAETANGDVNGINGQETTEPTTFELLSRPARPGRPLKVAIAGGGVGGLTAALCMLKNGCDVTVYEKTASFARFGGPIQLASNALSVFKAIDDELFDRVMDKFTFTATRACGIKDGTIFEG